MDWFFCISLIILVLIFNAKNRRPWPRIFRPKVQLRQEDIWRPLSKADKQRQKDIEQLKRQGYTDEVIAMIIPVIYDGQ